MMQSTEAMDHCWCFSHITLQIVARVFLLPFCNWCFSRQPIDVKFGWLNFIPSEVICNKCVWNETTLRGVSEGRGLLYFLFFLNLNFYFYFILLTILYWFWHTLTWICHGCSWAPKHEPPLPPPTPHHPSGSSQCTSPKHPAFCIKHRLAIRF